MTASLARLVFPALRWRRGSYEHERAKIDAALAAGVGGFIIFGGTREATATLTRELRQQAGRPLLIGADLERGPAQQVQGLTELPSAAALGWLDDLDATGGCGVITAVEARAVGINWAFAPVCDLDLEAKNPIVQTRSFGADPVRVGEQAAVWIRALQEHGVLGCAKHYPGHGRTLEDSHATLPRVHASLAELQQVDGAPFEYAVRAGVGSVMSAFVAYPEWDPSGRAASFSSDILGYLRATLNFGGLVVTDALIMAGARAAQPVPAATVGAVAAGCDALLYPEDFSRVAAALDRAVGGELPAARADDALARYEQAVSQWGDLLNRADQGSPISPRTPPSRTASPTGRRTWCGARSHASRRPQPWRSWTTTSADPIRSGRATYSTRRYATRESISGKGKRERGNGSFWCTRNRARGKGGPISARDRVPRCGAWCLGRSSWCCSAIRGWRRRSPAGCRSCCAGMVKCSCSVPLQGES